MLARACAGVMLLKANLDLLVDLGDLLHPPVSLAMGSTHSTMSAVREGAKQKPVDGVPGRVYV